MGNIPFEFEFPEGMWFIRNANNQHLMYQTPEGHSVILCTEELIAEQIAMKAGNDFSPYKIDDPKETANLLDMFKTDGVKSVSVDPAKNRFSISIENFIAEIRAKSGDETPID